MKSQVGLWIDHRETVIVKLIDQVEEIIRITSDVEHPISDSDVDAPHVSQQNRHTKRFDNQLNKYYGELINIICNVSSILIFGPGEAKFDIQKKLQRRGLDKHIEAVEKANSMTESQIAAKVRKHFAN